MIGSREGQCACTLAHTIKNFEIWFLDVSATNEPWQFSQDLLLPRASISMSRRISPSPGQDDLIGILQGEVKMSCKKAFWDQGHSIPRPRQAPPGHQGIICQASVASLSRCFSIPAAQPIAAESFLGHASAVLHATMHLL